MDNKKVIMAKTAASHARKTNGELGGRTSIMPGGSAERAVCSVAVQDAPVLLVAPAAAQVAAAPRLTPPFKNCTVPVGPCVELLVDETVAVSVTVPPEAMTVRLEFAAVVVAACVMEIVFVADVLAVKLLSPA